MSFSFDSLWYLEESGDFCQGLSFIPHWLVSKLQVPSEFTYPDSINLESGVNFYSSYDSSLPD